MLDFRNSKRPAVRNFQSRREQWRLLFLVASLGVVILLIRQIQQPDTSAAASRILGQPVIEGEQLQPKDAAIPTDAEASISTDAAAEIRDNAPFRSAEQAAWFEYLAAARRLSTSLPTVNKATGVTYAQLVSQPTAYRGKLVTLRGTVRRATLERPAANELGIESYYRLIMQPDGDSRPIFVYCLDLPEVFPRGEQIEFPAAFAGYFFKNLSYQADRGPAIAPVVVCSAPLSTENASVARSRDFFSAEAIARLQDETPPQQPRNGVGATFDQLMQLAGWDAQRWATFTDDAPTEGAELSEITQLLRRLRTFDELSLKAWARPNVAVKELRDEPQAHRGQLLHLAGRARRVHEQKLSPEDAERLELPSYFECEIDLADDGGVATVFTTRVPKDWPRDRPIDEPVTVEAVFVKRYAQTEDRSPSMLFASRNVAWLPTAVNEPIVSFGESLLGGLGFDVGLLDTIQQHRSIRPEERNAFFSMLAVQDQMAPEQLVRLAETELVAFRQFWASHVESPDHARSQLAREVLVRADQGRFSVAPLFNEAENQVGRLVMLEGVARRAVRINVGTTSDDSASDTAQFFGFGHYFELDVFTDDSQNRPVVFCVRELPAGFPTGAGLDVPVRVAGFYFKSWRYQSQGLRDTATGEQQTDSIRGLISPLFIGRSPIVTEAEASAAPLATPIAIGLFLLAFAAVWGLVWWYSLEDRQFRRRTIDPVYSLPNGESVDAAKEANSSDGRPIVF